ncbi:MAG: hypothetical protein HZC28_11105 [Spirochaetes bacterium]|nr:hypothetical protein [Spirochaetota bacterium]
MRSAVIFGLIVACSISAQEIIPGFKVLQDGDFSIGFIKGTIYAAKDWNSGRTVTPAPGFPKKSASSYELQGEYRLLKGGVFSIAETIRKTGDASVHYEVALKSDIDITLDALAVRLELPADLIKGKTITFDDKAVTPPVDFAGELGVYNGSGVKRIVIPSPSGKLVVTGLFDVYMQDSRKWGPTFEIRIYFDKAKGPISQASARVTFTAGSFESMPISIASAANMAFKDETADDKKGGWTDQGKENDLRSLPTGRQTFGGVAFDIVNPDKNDGKSCLSFAGPARDYFLKDAYVDAGGKEFNYLYVLHAIAWAPSTKETVGKIKVTYADDTSSVIDVVKGVDVGNWWGPDDVSNGMVVWTATNASSFVGLFMSKYPVDKKPVKTIGFKSTGKAVWMVAGITGSPDNVPFTAFAPVYIVAGEKWQPIEGKIDTEKGSILDFSSTLDAPAGKYGFVVAKNGHFEFENRPGVKARFYGCNFCGTANYLEKAEAEEFAGRIARVGYNAVRYHHHDNPLVETPRGETPKTDTVTPTPAQFDKLDYLFYCFKQKGIYATTDLYVSRRAKKGEIPEVPHTIDMNEYKALVQLLPSAMDNWKKYTKAFLEHVNPYTKLAWKDDPSLISLNVINEGQLINTWDSTPDTARITLEQFSAWCVKKGVTVPDKGLEREKEFMKFILEKQIVAFEEMKQFVRSLGCKMVLSDANHVSSIYLAMYRTHFDYVDNHGYWDHPNFPEQQWRLPYQFHNKMATAELAPLPRGYLPSRDFTKPMMFTEFQYTFPNPYRAEAGPLMGAYCAMQDWDGIFRFAYSHNRDKIISDQPASGFDHAADVIGALSEKIMLLLFLRGDVKPAERSFVLAASGDYVAKSEGLDANRWGSYPSSFSYLGLLGKVGTVVLKDGETLAGNYAAAVGVQPSLNGRTGNVKYYPGDETLIDALVKDGVFGKASLDVSNKKAVSDTKEISIDGSNGIFRVVTEKSEAFVVADKQSVSGDVLSVTSEEGFCVASASSMDGKKLTDSRRILVLHITDARNTKMRFANKKMTLLADNGSLPRLIAYVRASLSLKLSTPDVTVFGCDHTGRRIAPVAVRKTADGISFTAETIQGGKAKYMVYDIEGR